MSTITREQAQKIIEASDEVITALAGTNEDVHPESDSMLRLWDDLNDRYAPPEVVRELARIALASLEAEAVGEVVLGEYDDCGCHPDARVVCIAADGQADWENFKDGTRLYAAPPSLAAIDERAAFNTWNNDENLPIAGVGAKNAAWLAWQARAKLTSPPALVANIHPLLEFAREYIESWDLGMAGDSSLLASAKKAIADSSAHQPAPASVPAVPKEVSHCLSFFASVIKSGEPWTATCQQEYDAARAAMLNQEKSNG